jgi:gluconate 2-dehydrogenase gamma chain
MTVSRRDLLKRASLAGAAITMPSLPAAERQARPATASAPASDAVKREPVENLTQSEADLLEAICARIIPTDANGPGAREARAAHYIDRALGGALKESRDAYRAGFEAFDRYCRASRGAAFTALSERDQDSVLIDVETGAATGFTGSSSAFFNLLRAHTLQGTFGDPFYGGNANFVGWDLIGYPGLRLNVTPEDQRLGARLVPTHTSAYDSDMFTKAQARHSGQSAPSAALGKLVADAD